MFVNLELGRSRRFVLILDLPIRDIFQLRGLRNDVEFPEGMFVGSVEESAARKNQSADSITRGKRCGPCGVLEMRRSRSGALTADREISQEQRDARNAPHKMRAPTNLMADFGIFGCCDRPHRLEVEVQLPAGIQAFGSIPARTR